MRVDVVLSLEIEGEVLQSKVDEELNRVLDGLYSWVKSACFAWVAGTVLELRAPSGEWSVRVR